MGMCHETQRSEKVAGLVHLGFGLMYLVAIGFHLGAAWEHFRSNRKANG